MLLPSGIESVDDIQWDLSMAIEHANTIVGWQRNLSKEEMPPRWMWPFPDELSDWFDEVELAREQRYGNRGGDGSEEKMDGNMLAKEGVRQRL